jgi:hypothetical protein
MTSKIQFQVKRLDNAWRAHNLLDTLPGTYDFKENCLNRKYQ